MTAGSNVTVVTRSTGRNMTKVSSRPDMTDEKTEAVSERIADLDMAEALRAAGRHRGESGGPDTQTTVADVRRLAHEWFARKKT